MSEFKLPGRGFTEGSVKIDGYDVLYASGGSGDSVLVSLPGSAGLELSRGKDLLAEKMRVIEINPPGWGVKDDVSGKIDQKDLALLLARVVAALGVDRYHLLGTSAGGINALWLTLQHPERVKSLVLDAAMTFMAPEYLRHPEADELTAAIQAGMVPKEQVEQIIKNIPPHQYEAKPWMDRAYFEDLMRKRFRMFPHLTNQFEAELNARAASVKCPVLAIVGDQDEIMKPNIRESYARHMPQARFEMPPGGGHDLQGSHPEVFARIVGDFVEAAETLAVA